jgi:hypothetical protein
MEQNSRPDWLHENSLTSPEDRDLNNKWRPDQGAKDLSNSEVDSAIDNLSYKQLYPIIERTYCDFPVGGQQIGLFSFTPAKGASPNKEGFYGFAKLRGNFNTQFEADEQAEKIIRNSGTCHQIFHTSVGRPFPLTVSSKYSEDIDSVDIQKESARAISKERKEQRDKEKDEETTIRKREEALLEDTKTDDDPYDEYITLKTKKAQLTWTYLEHQKKIEEIKGILIKTKNELDEYDVSHPGFKGDYFQKYMDARKAAGMEDTEESSQNNFIKYMVEDVKLDFEK